MTEPTHATKQDARLHVLGADGRRAPIPDWAIDGRLDAADLCLLLLGPADETPVGLISALTEQPLAVVVVGPAAEQGWRDTVMSAGAFGCLSDTTPREDRISLLHAARRYQTARSEIAWLRTHHDRLCAELVQSFGDAMEKLVAAQDDASRIRAALEDIRIRVIKTLI